MTTNITELASHMRGLAEAATPGQWRFVNHNNEPELSQASDDFSVVSADGKVIVSEPSCSHERLPEVCNGAYIAAANPAKVITILDAMEAAQAEVAQFKRALEIEQSVSDSAAAQAEKLIEQRDAALARLAEIEAGASPVQPGQVLDAQRYSLLRSCRGMEHDPLLTVVHEMDGVLWGADLDDAVDAAINAKGAAS